MCARVSAHPPHPQPAGRGGRRARDPEDGPSPTVDHREEVESTTARAWRQAGELSDRLARLAEDVADSEDKVALVYEESARVRPHAADRLQEAARDAREFAEREREYARRVREQDDGPPDTPEP